MINEHKEFLEYTTKYDEAQKGGSTWGRIPKGAIYEGIGLERALATVARGYLYHQFDNKGNIVKSYSKKEALKRSESTEKYLKYWLTGDKTYLESLFDKSSFKPYSFKQYLEDVKVDSDTKKNSINDDAGVEVNNNKRGLENDIKKIEQYLNTNHTKKVKRLFELMDKHPDEELKYDESSTTYLNKEEIIKMLDSLLAKKTKKNEADKKEINKLKKYFSDLDEKDDSYKEDDSFKEHHKSFVELMNKHKIVVNENNIIIKTLKNLLNIIPADESEDRKDAQKLYDYFVSDEERTKASYHLYNRFFFCTQYTNPFTYGKNFNFKSVVVTALHEGPFSTNGCFSVDKKTLNIIIKAMESEKGRQNSQFIWQWVVFIFVAAYCKSRRSFQTEDSFTYHPYVLSMLDSWPKRDGKGFTDLFNKRYKCDQYGEKLLICSLKQKYFGKDYIKIAVNKEILDGIKFVNNRTADTEDYIVLRDCGINSYNESIVKLNSFYAEYKKVVAKERKFLALISKLSKKTKTSFFKACEHDINQLSQNICKNANKITEKNKNQKGIRKNIVTAVKYFEQMKSLKTNAESNYMNLITIQNIGSSMEIREKAAQLKNSIQDSYEGILQIFNNSLQSIEKSISIIGCTYEELLEESVKKA